MLLSVDAVCKLNKKLKVDQVEMLHATTGRIFFVSLSLKVTSTMGRRAGWSLKPSTHKKSAFSPQHISFLNRFVSFYYANYVCVCVCVCVMDTFIVLHFQLLSFHFPFVYMNLYAIIKWKLSAACRS